MHRPPCGGWLWLRVLLLGGWDMGPFSCDAEPPGSGGLGELLGQVGEGLF